VFLDWCFLFVVCLLFVVFGLLFVVGLWFVVVFCFKSGVGLVVLFRPVCHYVGLLLGWLRRLL
jgi:hypothetical protein